MFHLGEKDDHMYRVFYRNCYGQSGSTKMLPCKLMERDFVSATEAMTFADDLLDFEDIKIYSDEKLIWSSNNGSSNFNNKTKPQVHWSAYIPPTFIRSVKRTSIKFIHLIVTTSLHLQSKSTANSNILFQINLEPFQLNCLKSKRSICNGLDISKLNNVTFGTCNSRCLGDYKISTSYFTVHRGSLDSYLKTSVDFDLLSKHEEYSLAPKYRKQWDLGFK